MEGNQRIFRATGFIESSFNWQHSIPTQAGEAELNFCCSTLCCEELRDPEAPAVTPITIVPAGVWRLTVVVGPRWSLIGVRWKVQHS